MWVDAWSFPGVHASQGCEDFAPPRRGYKVHADFPNRELFSGHGHGASEIPAFVRQRQEDYYESEAFLSCMRLPVCLSLGWKVRSCGVTTTWGTVLEGHSVRKVEDHWSTRKAGPKWVETSFLCIFFLLITHSQMKKISQYSIPAFNSINIF